MIFIGFEMDDIPEEFLDRRYHDTENLVIYKIMTNMVAEFKNHKIGYDRIMSLRLHELIVQLERLKAIEKDTRVDITEIAMRYIEQYYSDTVDWNRLAASCNYSYSQFRHVFTKKVGISLNQYLMNCRLNAAKKLLIGTTLSCTEISYRCGFSNSSKFSTYFRKTVGLSPKDFRLQTKKSSATDADEEIDSKE